MSKCASGISRYLVDKPIYVYRHNLDNVTILRSAKCSPGNKNTIYNWHDSAILCQDQLYVIYRSIEVYSIASQTGDVGFEFRHHPAISNQVWFALSASNVQ